MIRLPEPGPRRDLWIAVLFFLIAAACRFPRLSYPPEEIFDEVYHAKAALSYLRGEMPVEWVHPPTAKVLISSAVWLLGYDSFAWRLAPAIAGSLLAPVFFLLARRVLPSERAALIATALLLVDGVYLVQSRTAMTNIFAVLFQVTAAYALVRAVLAERLPFPWMLALGLALGLAISTRWTSLWALGFLGLVLVATRWRKPIAWRDPPLVAMAFVVMPALVYLASYWCYPVMRPTSVEHLWNTQKAMWEYHATLNATHAYFSPWYTWPWLARPTWYYYKQQADSVFGIVALGNPALWWASVPATLAALVTGIRERDPRRLFAAVGFVCLYLPWGLAPRKLNFSHYLFEALPYACLSLGFFLDRALDDRRWRQWAWAYLGVCLGLFLFFFPILTAYPIPLWLFQSELFGRMPWLWFKSWI